MKNCYCCSEKKFEDCCESFIAEITKPPTAEALMRSRYSAYVLVNVDYILKTTHHSKSEFLDGPAIEKWAKSCLWQKLEIISTSRGNSKDTVGTVEFKAYYLDLGLRSQIHHEYSNFVKDKGVWFFVDGKS
jgi:SEC-C motif domain protein